MAFGWIAFLTDYGRSDGFVAACHGVIARTAPAVRVIDVSHDVPPQDVRHGAVVLAQTLPYLPPSVVLGVVDPGVGTQRRPVALVAGEHVLIGPDNGLLTWAADACGGISRAVQLSVALHRPTGAVTFDGREVFAPAAAHVAAGSAVGSLGADVPVDSVVRLPSPWVVSRPGALEAEVYVVDHFGNVALAARADDLERAGLARPDSVTVEAAARTWQVRVGRSFADVGPGEPVVLIDSAGQVALAVNQGSAAATLGLQVGDRVTITTCPRAENDHVK